MKFRDAVLFATLTCFIPLMASGQDDTCYGSPTLVPLHCTGTNCSKNIFVIIAPEQFQGSFATTTFVDCCGTGIGTLNGFFGDCEIVELRTPQARERLAKLSRERQVIIAGCDNNYRLFSVVQQDKLSHIVNAGDRKL
jgi:hypothetical protein